MAGTGREHKGPDANLLRPHQALFDIGRYLSGCRLLRELDDLLEGGDRRRVLARDLGFEDVRPGPGRVGDDRDTGLTLGVDRQVDDEWVAGVVRRVRSSADRP